VTKKALRFLNSLDETLTKSGLHKEYKGKIKRLYELIVLILTTQIVKEPK